MNHAINNTVTFQDDRLNKYSPSFPSRRVGRLCTVKGVKSRQHHPAVIIDVFVRSLVHPLHQVLLIEQRVVGTHGAGCIFEVLIVVAELGFALGRQELIDVDHVAE